MLILINLFYNKIECYTNTKSYKKNLVFTSAGNNTNFDKLWTGNNRNYDIWVVYYDNNNTKYNQYKNKVDRIWKRKGSKFQNFNYIYNRYYDYLIKYDRIYIVDDDIIMNTDQINELFNTSEKYDLWICQPAFLPESKYSHKITLQQNDLLRYTNFIELGVPLFSLEALKKFMKYYDNSLIGWGIDYLYIWANGNNVKNKYAIIDSIPCINPHDEAKQGKRELNKINNYEKRAYTWKIYSTQIGCPFSWNHIIYSTIY
jgi:hypothetical protein